MSLETSCGELKLFHACDGVVRLEVLAQSIECLRERAGSALAVRIRPWNRKQLVAEHPSFACAR